MGKLLLSVLLLAGFPAFAQSAPVAPLIFLDSDGVEADGPKGAVTVVEWFITPSVLEKLPAFDPKKDEPPLSLKAAVAIGQGIMLKNVTTPDKWGLDSIEIGEIDRGESGVTIPSGWVPQKTGKWYYKITFSEPVDAHQIATKSYIMPYVVFVLMDGSVAERRERPQTDEEKKSDSDFGDSLKKAIKDDSKP